MKLWELDWTEGKQYKGYHRYHTEQIWTVKDGSLVNNLGNITKFYNLEIISQLDFEPYTDWSKVEVDTKILARDDENETWSKRHFAKYENDNVFTFWAGSTSWTHPCGSSLTYWKYAKLAESEE